MLIKYNMASQESCSHANDVALTTEKHMQSVLNCTNEIGDACTDTNAVSHNDKPKLYSYDVACDYGDDLLADVRLAWVDNPKPDSFKSHRALTRYSRELKMITDVMRDYSRCQGSKQQGLLDEILNYGQKAHQLYDNALHQWLEDNPMAHSRPAVLKLVKQHGECGSRDLRRYHDRASKEPDCRSEATVSVYSDTTISNVSETSLLII